MGLPHTGDRSVLRPCAPYSYAVYEPATQRFTYYEQDVAAREDKKRKGRSQVTHSAIFAVDMGSSGAAPARCAAIAACEPGDAGALRLSRRRRPTPPIAPRDKCAVQGHPVAKGTRAVPWAKWRAAVGAAAVRTAALGLRR